MGLMTKFGQISTQAHTTPTQSWGSKHNLLYFFIVFYIQEVKGYAQI